MTSISEAPTTISKPNAAPSSLRRILRRVLFVLLGVGLGTAGVLGFQRAFRKDTTVSDLETPLRPGPWGELYSIPFTISAPEELLPVRDIEAAGVRWLFKGLDRQQLDRFLNSAGVGTALCTTLMSSAKEVPGTEFIELRPSADAVVAIPASARKKIYQRLDSTPENRFAFYYLHKDSIPDRIREDMLSEKTIALFRKLSVEHGEYLVFGGLPALLAQTPDLQEKTRFIKCLSRQKTLLLRIRLTKTSDVAGLTKYWGKGPYAPNVRSLLDALHDVPGGTFCSLLSILPPLPTAQAYNYPISHNRQEGGVLANFDCHWTSVNFFNEVAGPQPTDALYFSKEIREQYGLVTDSPRFGDLLVMTTPSDEIIHTAVFIADDIFFTKNGSTSIYPWMFAKLPDLLKQYSFRAPEGQQLVLRYFRHKAL